MTRMYNEVVCLSEASLKYPFVLKKYLGEDTPGAIWTLGSLDLLQQKAIVLSCSIKCSGNLILKTYDLARSLRDNGIVVISGFHSPMERESLNILLKGEQSIIICPARRIEGMRLSQEFKKSLAEGQLLIISPFGEKVGRATADTATSRNEFVTALGDRVFVAYAATGSKTEALCCKVLAWGKPLYTFGDNANANLLKLGAQPLDPSSMYL